MSKKIKVSRKMLNKLSVDLLFAVNTIHELLTTLPDKKGNPYAHGTAASLDDIVNKMDDPEWRKASGLQAVLDEKTPVPYTPKIRKLNVDHVEPVSMAVNQADGLRGVPGRGKTEKWSTNPYTRTQQEVLGNTPERKAPLLTKEEKGRRIAEGLRKRKERLDAEAASSTEAKAAQAKAAWTRGQAISEGQHRARKARLLAQIKAKK